MSLDSRLQEARQRLSEENIHAQEVSPSEIKILAAHREVGDILIRSTYGDLTVIVGEHFHHHFASQEDSPRSTEDVVQFVTAFAKDRSVLTIKYSGTRTISARIENVESGASYVVVSSRGSLSPWSRIVATISRVFITAFGARPSIRSFKWSGPICYDESDPATGDDRATELANQLAELSSGQMGELTKYLSRQARRTKSQDQNQEP